MNKEGDALFILEELKMSIKRVKVHKMYEEFHMFPPLTYVGEYDVFNNLIHVYNSLNQKLTRIVGTYQWVLIDADSTSDPKDVYFVEEDPEYNFKTAH